MGKRRTACNCVSGIKKICSEKVCASCSLVEMILVMTTVPSFTCFSMFLYIHARFCFMPIGGNNSSVDREPLQGIGGKFKFQRHCCKLILFLQRGKI